MALKEGRKGELYVAAATFVGGIFPIIGALAVHTVPPLTALFFSTIVTTIFFVPFIAYKRPWHEFRSWTVWRYSFIVAVLIGFLLYGFFFLGLRYTSPGNAAIINLFAVFTSFIFFNMWRGEPISFSYKIGALLMVLGAIIVLVPGFSSANLGDLYILLATVCAPIGNYYQQKVRDIASSETLMFLRSILSLPFIGLLALFLQEHTSVQNLYDAAPYLLINGAIVLGLSKIFWIEAIHRMLVTKAEAFFSAAPFVTLLFAHLILDQTPTLWQIVAIVPLFIGVLLLTDQIRLRRRKLA